MKSLSIIFVSIFISCSISAQDTTSKWTLEPALSINPAKLTIGVGDIGISMVTDYQLNEKWSLVNYTNIHNTFFHTRNGFLANLNSKYDVGINHLYGIGYSIQKKKSIDTWYLIGGIYWHQYKETITNEALNINYNYTSRATLNEDFGILYKSTNTVREGLNFTMRYYFPLTHGLNIFDNLQQSSLDFGVSFDL